MILANGKRSFLPIRACVELARARKERFDEEGREGPSPQTSSSRLARFLESSGARFGVAGVLGAHGPRCVWGRRCSSAFGVAYAPRYQSVCGNNLVRCASNTTLLVETTRLSRAMAAELYGARWGIEVEYRGLKQTLGRRKVLAKSPEAGGLELSGNILALA